MPADLEGLSGIVVVDTTAPGQPIVYVSAGFETLTGYSSAEAIGRNCSFLQGPDTDPRSVAVLGQAIAEGREAHVTLLNYRADGTPFYNEVSIAPERDAEGRVVRYLGVQRDVTDAMRADARIAELSYFDPLTGLANRAALHDELRSALHRARIHDRELALLLIDLDDFQRVNDRHGQDAGDAVLREVAARLRSIVRPQDLLARPSGDEFTLLVKDVPSDAAGVGSDLAARIVVALREPLLAGGVAVDLRASVGVSAFPRDAVTAEDLLRHANAAMFAAKGGGKDGFHVYRSRAVGLGLDPDDAFDPAGHRAELDRVLAAGITAVYQPIIDLATDQVVAYEALSRGPEGSPLHRPDRLFAAATAAGRVVELDWACRAAAVRGALDAGLGRSASLFLNCEPSAVDAPCPPQHLALWDRAVRELDLVFEITERALTDRPAELSRVIADHRAAGRGIALDDLGADIRSLALLPLVEPDVIKLDLGLVQDRPTTDQAAIVSGVAAECERTGAAVLAEGIESDAHLARARSLGATLGQGFRWGRPGPLPRAAQTSRVRSRTHASARAGRTPFAVVSAERPVAEATKALLLPMSRHLENRALRIGEGAVILSAFQDARHFTGATVRRYETLARSASLVAAFGVGLPEEPVRGVRGARLADDDPLAGEWSVVVLGPHFAGALVGRDLGDRCAERDRRFEFATVYDRGLVIAAARTLLSRIAPAGTREGAQIF